MGEDRGKPVHVVTRAADLQEKGQGMAGHGQGKARQGLDWTGLDGYGVVCAPQPFETATETEAL